MSCAVVVGGDGVDAGWESAWTAALWLIDRPLLLQLTFHTASTHLFLHVPLTSPFPDSPPVQVSRSVRCWKPTRSW